MISPDDVGLRAIDGIEVEHHDPQRDADMRRRDPDAGRGAHRLQQVARQFVQRIVKRRDGPRREREPGVGIANDGADGHTLL